MLESLIPTVLHTPHIPLDTGLEEGLSILKSNGLEIVQIYEQRECVHKASGRKFSVAIYSAGDRVVSAWYDDSAGRLTAWGRKAKIKLYLARYGNLTDWEMRMENGWIRYWFNPVSKVAMAYGIHGDVLRFNIYDDE